LDKQDLVKSISLSRESTSSFLYVIETLESVRIKVEFIRSVGYTMENELYENMQAILSKISPAYRKAFANKISAQLSAKLMAAASTGPLAPS